MQGINDPQNFELSQVVQKNSKSGIFTNKRLIMIKDGYLNYFSNVPTDYKENESNVISLTKELPKSSVEIRCIQAKLESAKSKTLIINYRSKDMLDRQQLRKSISSKVMKQPVKQSESDQIEEWVFIFASVQKCRQWYACLTKLKQYFTKSQAKEEKFAQYMANFDPEIRKSLPQNSHQNNQARMSAPNINIARQKSNEKYKLDKSSGIFQIQEAAQEYDSQITPKAQNDKLGNSNNSTMLSNNNSTVLSENKSEISIEIKPDMTKQRIDKKQEKEKKSEADSDKKIQEQNWRRIQQQAEASRQQEKRKQKEQEQLRKQKGQQQIKQAKQIKSQNHSKSQAQTKQSIQIKKKAEQIIFFEQQLSKREEIIKQMEEQLLQKTRKTDELQLSLQLERQRREQQEGMRTRLEREKKEDEQYRRLRQSIATQTVIETQILPKQVILIEESMQTEYQRDIIQVMESQFRPPTNRFSRNSFKSQFSITPVNFQHQSNFLRHTISNISEVQINPSKDFEGYDYYWQLGRIYKTQDPKEKITRELSLVQFVRKASRKAIQLVQDYIHLNQPKQSITIDRSVFQIEIVCQRGRLMRTARGQQLIYNNQSHQKLKQTFKIFNQMTSKIISILKKKSDFPLRVPFCCLVEYKGYTALAKIMPDLQQKNTLNAHLLKGLGQSVPLVNFDYKDFTCHGQIYSMAQPSVLFKISKSDQSAIFKPSQTGFDFLTVNRRNNISISVDKLLEESKTIHSFSKQRLDLALNLRICRQLKKIMKTHSPFADIQDQLQFFRQFLCNPSQVMDLRGITEVNLSGLLLYYIERLLGIKMRERWDSDNPQFSVSPVSRQFSLSSLDVSVFAYNFQKYCADKKYDTALKALNYLKYIQEDYVQILIKQVFLNVYLQKYDQALEKLPLVLQLVSLHDPRRMRVLQLEAQCLEARGRNLQALARLKELLEATEYTYGASQQLAEVYFKIASSLGRQKLMDGLIQVYRKIILGWPNHRQRVLIEFSQTLLIHSDIDPHVLLDFLQKQLQDQIQSDNPSVQYTMGQLYLSVGNKTKALGAYSRAFQQMLFAGKNFVSIYDTFARISECSSSIKEKKAVHRQLFTRVSTEFGESQSGKAVNTLLCMWMIESMKESERDKLINCLQQVENASGCRLLEWNWLQSVLRRIGQSEYVSATEKATFMSVIHVNRVSECCILLNNPNFV